MRNAALLPHFRGCRHGQATLPDQEKDICGRLPAHLQASAARIAPVKAMRQPCITFSNVSHLRTGRMQENSGAAE
jgi:hypothetical protein